MIQATGRPGLLARFYVVVLDEVQTPKLAKLAAFLLPR